MPVTRRFWNYEQCAFALGTTLLVIFIVPLRLTLEIALRLGMWQKPDRKKLTTTLEEQLNGNYEPRGGYRAGVGHYASVWTRDSYFALVAPIPERGERLRVFADRLRDAINKDSHVRAKAVPRARARTKTLTRSLTHTHKHTNTHSLTQQTHTRTHARTRTRTRPRDAVVRVPPPHALLPPSFRRAFSFSAHRLTGSFYFL
jgi:hypothetical protein